MVEGAKRVSRRASSSHDVLTDSRTGYLKGRNMPSPKTVITIILAACFQIPASWNPLLAQDCNNNGVADECDIACGPPAGPCDVPGCGGSQDCNSNGIPDECEASQSEALFFDDFPDAAIDSQKWPVLDRAETVTSPVRSPPYALHIESSWTVESIVLDLSAMTNVAVRYYWRGTNTNWADTLVVEFWDGSAWQTLTSHAGGFNPGVWLVRRVYLPAEARHAGFKLRFRGGLWQSTRDWFIDDVAILQPLPDCNTNGIPDECDITSGFSQDTNGNGYPDECEVAYVDAAAPPGGDGASWATAYDDLQVALAAIGQTSGGVFNVTIRVAESTYKPAGPGGSRDASFQLLPGVILEGGYAGLGQPDPDERDPVMHVTRLSGDLNGDDGPDFANNDENSYHVLQAEGYAADGSAILDGFSVSAGNGNEPIGRGGGLRNSFASPTIIDCAFTGNSAEQGGAVANMDGSSPTLLTCTFSNNRSLGSGGAMHNIWGSSPLITTCVFTGNTANGTGGAIHVQHDSNPTISDCVFDTNSSSSAGGAIYALDVGSHAVSDCTFTNNTSGNSGGAVFYSDCDEALITSCTFASNVASRAGGGLGASGTNITMRDCTILGNQALSISGGNGGGGVFHASSNTTGLFVNCVFSGNITNADGGGFGTRISIANAAFVNTTFSANIAQGNGGGLYKSQPGNLSLVNCIVWGNSDASGTGESAQIRADDGILSVDYSCIQNLSGALGGLENIADNPLFVDADGTDNIFGTADDDLHLSAASPCVNRGDNSTPNLPTTDFEGDPRVQHCRVDMGADESAHLFDCNGNAIADACDIQSATSVDANANNLPDECEAQWADYVIAFSSQYDIDQWSAMQALGSPDVFFYGDSTNAWSPSSQNATLESITLGFNAPVFATGVTIRENLGNGFVTQIEVMDLSEVLTTTWTGIDPSQPGQVVDFIATWPTTTFRVKGVRITIDTDLDMAEWEEIDAVQLHGDFLVDCNNNGITDALDIQSGTSSDCDGNTVPDDCEFTIGLSSPPAGAVQNRSNGHFYLLTTPMLWSDAESFAVSIAGHLATIRNLADNQWLYDTFVQQVSAPGVFIGFNDIAFEGTFLWSSGEDVVFTNWASDEPSNMNHEDVVVIVADGINAGGWNDINTSIVRPSVVEITLNNDCNGNGILDSCDIASGTSIDCNGTGIPDQCEPDTTLDCNNNGQGDSCDIQTGASMDCNDDGIPDDCQLIGNDCNTNGIPDECEPDCDGDLVPDACAILGGSPDCNINTIPDECEPDCNGNGVADECDISGPTSFDCNMNAIPDDCETVLEFSSGSGPLSPFDTGNWQTHVFTGLPDAIGNVTLECTANAGLVNSLSVVEIWINGMHLVTVFAGEAGNACGELSIDTTLIPSASWNAFILQGMGDVTVQMRERFYGTCPDSFIAVTVTYAIENDCNSNGIPDDCDIAIGTSPDLNSDGIPDECSPDCNLNGTPDVVDISSGASTDCDFNRIPDECEVPPLGPATQDCNFNGIPDVCEADCNGNGLPDDCDVAVTLALFSSAGIYTADDQPWDVLAVDLDLDGDEDMVVANRSSATISVFRNRGDGSFLPAVNYDTRPLPQKVVAGDFDKDGDKDLAVACSNFTLITVRFNSGNGTFGTRSDYSVTADAYSIATADLDGDGDLDLATAAYDGNRCDVLLNNGLDAGQVWQGFATAISFTATGGPLDIEIADIDGDTLPDLAVAKSNGNTVSVFLNLGVDVNQAWLGFAAEIAFSAGTSPSSIVAKDLDLDGDNDLVSANRDSNDITIFLNNGQDTGGNWQGLATGFSEPVGIQPRDVDADDLNGDGFPELIVANSGFASTPNTSVGLLANLGNDGMGLWQGYAAIVEFVGGDRPYGVTTGEFNGDSQRDIAVASFYSGEAWVMLNDGTGGYGKENLIQTGRDPWSIEIADLDGDQIMDLVVTNRREDDVSVVLGLGGGDFAAPIDFPVGDAPESVAVGDLDGDGDIDLAVANDGWNSVGVLLNNGQDMMGVWQGYAPQVTYATGTNPSSVVITELDGLNRPDLVVVNGNSSTLSILLNNGNGSFGTATNLALGPAPQQVIASDFDDDGDVDLAVAHSQTNDLYLFLNDGAGGFPPATIVSALQSRSLAPGDFDNDGDLDIASANGGFGGGILILLNNGTDAQQNWLGFAPGISYPDAGSAYWITTGDLNDDAFLDIVVANKLANKLTLMLNVGNGTFLAAGSPPIGKTPEFVITGELTGDAFVDIVAALTGYEGFDFVTLLTNESLGAASPDCNVNLLPDDCDLPGDMNGDGVVDDGDVGGFVGDLLLGPCGPLSDMNGDGTTDGGDIQEFIDDLLGG